MMADEDEIKAISSRCAQRCRRVSLQHSKKTLNWSRSTNPSDELENGVTEICSILENDISNLAPIYDVLAKLSKPLDKSGENQPNALDFETQYCALILEFGKHFQHCGKNTNQIREILLEFVSVFEMKNSGIKGNADQFSNSNAKTKTFEPLIETCVSNSAKTKRDDTEVNPVNAFICTDTQIKAAKLVNDHASEIEFLTGEKVELNESLQTSLNASFLVDEFNVDDKLNRKFIGKQLLNIPFNCRVVAKNTYNRLLKLPVKGEFQANTYLRELQGFCKSMPVDVTWSESQIKLVAKTKASQCHQLCINMLELDESKATILFALEAVLVGYSIAARKGKTIEGNIARYVCDKWWSKKLLKLHRVSVERISQYVHLVSKQSQIYVSDTNFKKGRENKRRNQLFMDSLELVNELGDVVDLKDMANSNNSNPVNRRNELMARLHGFEVYADKYGYVADFLTITCPSRMHGTHSSGKENEKYDGTTSKEANQYLGNQFAKCRAQLARMGADYFGFRVAEPHHDGTPHWHILVFVKPEQRKALREIFSFYALQVDGDETGAQKYRFTVGVLQASCRLSLYLCHLTFFYL
jgi:hypothetical protein